MATESECMNSARDDPSPLLYLNVDVEGSGDVKIPVFNSDNMKSITLKVRQMAGLMDADESKLEEILRLQILPALHEFGLLNEFD